jgi:hypothetical protein
VFVPCRACPAQLDLKSLEGSFSFRVRYTEQYTLLFLQCSEAYEAPIQLNVSHFGVMVLVINLVS